MNFFVALFCIAAVSADVSHLATNYLPPTTAKPFEHHHEIQQNLDTVALPAHSTFQSGPTISTYSTFGQSQPNSAVSTVAPTYASFESLPSVGPTFAPITATAAPIHSFAATAAPVHSFAATAAPVHSFAATAAPVHSYAAQTYSALASPVQAIPASYQASYPAFTYQPSTYEYAAPVFASNLQVPSGSYASYPTYSLPQASYPAYSGFETVYGGLSNYDTSLYTQAVQTLPAVSSIQSLPALTSVQALPTVSTGHDAVVTEAKFESRFSAPSSSYTPTATAAPSVAPLKPIVAEAPVQSAPVEPIPQKVQEFEPTTETPALKSSEAVGSVGSAASYNDIDGYVYKRPDTKF